jgi:hypothetical protein
VYDTLTFIEGKIMVSEQLHIEVSEYLDQVSDLVSKALDQEVYTSYLYGPPDRIVVRFNVGEALFSTDYSPSWNPKSLAENIINNY